MRFTRVPQMLQVQFPWLTSWWSEMCKLNRWIFLGNIHKHLLDFQKLNRSTFDFSAAIASISWTAWSCHPLVGGAAVGSSEWSGCDCLQRLNSWEFICIVWFNQAPYSCVNGLHYYQFITASWGGYVFWYSWAHSLYEPSMVLYLQYIVYICIYILRSTIRL